MSARSMNARTAARSKVLRAAGLLAALALAIAVSGHAVSFAASKVTCTVKSSSSNPAIYAGPQTTYAKLGNLKPGDVVEVDAVSANRLWARLTNGRWIPAYVLSCNLAGLPSISASSVSSPPTPRPDRSMVDPGVSFGAKAVAAAYQDAPGRYASTAGNPCQAWAVEQDMDRQGGGLRDFDLPRADQQECQRRCGDEPRCAAYVYGEPGTFFPGPHCWLKTVALAPIPNPGFTSGVKACGPVEPDINRQGYDYKNPIVPSQGECALQCFKDSRCWAYTYVTESRLCWLKVGGALPSRMSGVISGVKTYGVWDRYWIGPVGGTGGEWFEDRVPSGAKVVSIRVWSSDYVNAVQFQLSTGWLPKHGGGGGRLSEIRLVQGEFINEIYGNSGVYIDQINFATSRGRTFGPYGGGGGSSYALGAPNDYAIVGLWGRSGQLLDRLGVTVARR